MTVAPVVHNGQSIGGYGSKVANLIGGLARSNIVTVLSQDECQQITEVVVIFKEEHGAAWQG